MGLRFRSRPTRWQALRQRQTHSQHPMGIRTRQVGSPAPRGYMSVVRLIDSLRFEPLAQCSPFPPRFRYLRPGTGRPRSVRRPTPLCVRTLVQLLSLS
jgi:hypothetical protein